MENVDLADAVVKKVSVTPVVVVLVDLYDIDFVST